MVIAKAQLIGALAGNKLSLGESITLDGSNSSGSNSLTLNYLWLQLSGPVVTLIDADTAKASFIVPMVSNDIAVSFQLTVKNGENVTDTTVLTATILAEKKSPAKNTEISSGGSFGGVMAFFVLCNLLSRLIFTLLLMKPLVANGRIKLERFK